ncbi:hypothetical protein Aple_027360 [Acrocarpospora pleiomorpha]|uniref:Uncharacterized protein n=1 Tax=Acrocarpospora pleiomorpha TaxID=90975 RepID=A0A5M3XFL9_9ACTN|nr:hypothetical protein Aple_027360 [Acrocarpospora pleiomorpha]
MTVVPLASVLKSIGVTFGAGFIGGAFSCVITASTPGVFRAAAESIRVIRPRAIVE